MVSPYLSRNRESKPQGEPMGVRVKDAGESECHAVIAWIRIETVYGAATSSDPKGGRLPAGIPLRDNL
jgi:hypothetical protein